MKTLLSIVSLLALAVSAIAQPLPPATTAFTRDFLRSADSSNACYNLGIASTNQTTFTNFTTGTNWYVNVQANVVPAMSNPVGLFGTLRMTTTNALALPVDATYYNITNWNNAITNGFKAALATGYLTNTVAGYYSIHASISFIGAAGELYEVCVLTNNVDSEMVSSKKQFASPASRYDAVPVIGRMYLSANTGISLAIKNSTDNTTLTVHRACLDIGP
jgi:hypothetical protein